MDHADHELVAHLARIEDVITTLRTSNDTYSLADMADMACLSPYYFNRVFKQLIGIPPGAFQAALKIDRAKHLLISHDVSVTDTCFEVGYSSLGTFTSRFTELVGVSPSRFRELPEKIEPAIDRVRRNAEITANPRLPPPGFDGAVVAPEMPPSLIFVGAFVQGIPQREPAAGTILSEPGRYELGAVPNGRYVLLCAAIPMTVDPVNWLAPGTDLWVGGGQHVVVRHGSAHGDKTIILRKYLPTDPPILVSPFILLLTRMNRHR